MASDPDENARAAAVNLPGLIERFNSNCIYIFVLWPITIVCGLCLPWWLILAVPLKFGYEPFISKDFNDKLSRRRSTTLAFVGTTRKAFSTSAISQHLRNGTGWHLLARS